MLPIAFALLGCTTTVQGTVEGDVPRGARLLVLWPAPNALGVVGGSTEVAANGSFEVQVGPPGNDHTGLEFGTLVLFDGDPDNRDVLALDDIASVVGAAPRHYLVDSNATCTGEGCSTEGAFDRGTTCGECEDNGSCSPVACKQLEVFATDRPLSLDWRIPDADPVTGVYAEDGVHVAFVEDDAIVVLGGDELGGPIFRSDGRIDLIGGMHWGSRRVAVRMKDSVGVGTGHVRTFDGTKLLELDESGNLVLAGPVLSPDGSLVAAVTGIDGLQVYDLDAGGAVVAAADLPDGDWALHWSPTGEVVYAVPPVGGTPEALALGGATPTDWPACVDGPQTPAADACSGDRGAFVDWTLGHPVLLHWPCAVGGFSVLPRLTSAGPVRECFGDTDETGTVR